MACNTPASPASSPIGQLMLSASALTALKPGINYAQVQAAFEECKKLLWEVIEGSLDASAYKNSWHMVTTPALSDLLDYEQGHAEALTHLQMLIQSSVDSLP